MDEGKKATIISLGIGLVTAGQKILETKNTLCLVLGTVITVAGVVCIGSGVYWVISQIKEEFRKLRYFIDSRIYGKESEE